MMPNPSMEAYPHDIEAEYGLIGYIICNNSLMSQLGFLNSEHFYSAEYSDIFQAITKLHVDSQKITPFTIKPLLSEKTNRFLDETGGSIKHLASSISASGAMFAPVDEAYGLVKLARKRELAQVCVNIAAMICEGSGTLTDFTNELSSAIERITKENPLEDFQNDAQVIAEIIQDLKDNRQPHSTGFSSMDEAMGGGLYPGKSYGFAAKKKIGKTILASTISLNLSNQGVKHLFICGEMSPKEIHQRNLARITDSYPSAFRNSYGKSNDFQNKITEVMNASKHNILYRNAPGLTFDELRRVCKNAVERHRVNGIILDYWQLVGGKQKGQSDASHLDDVAQWIANFGRKHGVWNIVMAQINQEGNTRGGEGIRLAFDQVYAIKPQNDDPTLSGRWMEMMDTRYTKWNNLGTENSPRFLLNEKGPYFEQV